MKNLLYLPIDIDIGKLQFERNDSLQKMPVHHFQPKWWDSVILNKESIIENDLRSVIDQLPYVKITMAMHKYQTAPVDEHFDVYPQMKISPEELNEIKNNEPCGYRLVIKGRNNVLEVWDGSKWLTPKMPKSPCCYLINTTALKHRVKDDPGREIIYFRGILDPKKHLELIEKSLKKYQKYAVYLKD